MGLPFGQGAAQPGLVFRGRHQPLVVVENGFSIGSRPRLAWICRAKSRASSEKRGVPTSSMLPKVRSAIAWLVRPTRVLVTHRTEVLQPVIAATCRALRLSTV